MTIHVGGSLLATETLPETEHPEAIRPSPNRIGRVTTAVRVDRICALADALEQRATPVPGFSMTHPYASTHSIGRNVNRVRDDRGGLTAGLEVHVITYFAEVPVSTANVHGAAMQILGLTAAQAEALFRPTAIRPGNITREMAVATLRRLAATGEVNWSLPLMPRPRC